VAEGSLKVVVVYLSTTPDSRQNDTFESVIASSQSLAGEAEFNQGVEEFSRRMEENRRGGKSEEDRREQWLDRREGARSERIVHTGGFSAQMVRAGRISLADARNAAVDLEIEEMRRMEVILGFVQVYPRNIDWDLIPEEEEEDIPLAEQMRLWEQDEREKRTFEHGRPSGSSRFEVGVGTALSSLKWSSGMRMRLNEALGLYLRGLKRGVSERGNPLIYEAQGRKRRETAPDSKGTLWNIEQNAEVVFAHEALQGFCRSREIHARCVARVPAGGGSRRGDENTPAGD
jgi:hypothetical protein